MGVVAWVEIGEWHGLVVISVGLNQWLSRWLWVAVGIDVVAWVELMWRFGILAWVLMVWFLVGFVFWWWGLAIGFVG